MSPIFATPARSVPITLDSPNSVIVLSGPGLEVDTSLQVFDQEFRVSSGTLKMHSAFFRKFLDPLNGKSAGSGIKRKRSGIEYEWFTHIDQDGSWSLVSTKNSKESMANAFEGCKSHEIKAFHHLLCAMVGTEYEISNSAELILMTNLADYYCALPVLSRSLCGAFFTSPGLMGAIGSDPCNLLVAAKKLRNKVLFKECFIHVMGPWSAPRWLQLKDEQLITLARAAMAQQKSMLLDALADNILLMADSKIISKSNLSAAVELSRDMILGGPGLEKLAMPAYIRGLLTFYEQRYGSFGGLFTRLIDRLRALLVNNLRLDTRKLDAGLSSCVEIFLCFDVKDYPWNQSIND